MDFVKQWRLWEYSFLLWAGATLSFMAAMSITGALFMLLGVWVLWQQKPKAAWIFFTHTSFFKATIFLFFIAFLSTFYGYIHPPLGGPWAGATNLKKLLFFFYPFFVAIITKHSQKKLWRVLFWMSLAMSLVAIFQFWAGAIFGEAFVNDKVFFRRVAWSPYSHAQGIMFFHLSFASVISFSFCYALARALWRPPSDTKRQWMAWLVLAILSGAAVIYTYSRISWFAVIAVVILLLSLKKPRWAWRSSFVVLLLVAVYWFQSPDLRRRFTDVDGLKGRAIVWQASWEMIKDRPILGVGFEKTGEYSEAYIKKAFGQQQWFSSHAHNNVLDALAGTGILGLVAYLWWWTVLIVYCVRIYRASSLSERWLPAALLAGALAFQINGLTQINFYDGKCQPAIMLWVGLVLASYWDFCNRNTKKL